MCIGPNDWMNEWVFNLLNYMAALEDKDHMLSSFCVYSSHECILYYWWIMVELLIVSNLNFLIAT